MSSPFLSGFTIVRNGIRFDYPFRECISTLLELCDEVVVGVGDSDDGTREAVLALSHPKLIVFDSLWDITPSGGKVLATETTKALAQCTGAWCLYLQADELLHEQDFESLHREIVKASSIPRCDGLILPYYHFFQNYHTLATDRKWYRYEIRAFRNHCGVFSWGDAQGFRKRMPNGMIKKLEVLESHTPVYHYGWVRPTQAQRLKMASFHSLYDATAPVVIDHHTKGLYASRPFTGQHPSVMNEKITRDAVWALSSEVTLRKKPLTMALLDKLEDVTGYRLGEYKNYTRLSYGQGLV